MAPEKLSGHRGHRKRKRREFLDSRASAVSDADLLEMLLYYTVPRADTRPVAEALLEKYGTLAGILNADRNEIKTFSGLKDGAETLFALLKELAVRVGCAAALSDLIDGNNMERYLLARYRGLEAETVLAIYFDPEGNLVGEQIVFRGDINSARFSVRAVTEGAIKMGGKTVVLAHNHPSGSVFPSNDDVISTRRIALLLRANEIELSEHYIVGEDGCIGIINM